METNIKISKLPKIFLLGYGAIGKCFAEIVLKNFNNINLIVCDILPNKQLKNKFEFIQKEIRRDNINTIFKMLYNKEYKDLELKEPKYYLKKINSKKK